MAARRQRGLGLATALFVITVMALLAALILQLVRNNAQALEEEILLNRAFHAAESGIQFGLNRAWPPDGSASQCPASAGAPTVFTPPVFDVDGLQGCSAEITCSTLIVESVTYYTIRSTGNCGSISRTIEVRAK